MTKTKPNEPGAGCLYVVATPIGNLEDISLRALRMLKESDAIACEDTRQTLKLLSHFDIQKRLVSYHEHNEITRAAEIVIELEQGAQDRAGHRRRHAGNFRSRWQPGESGAASRNSSGAVAGRVARLWLRWPLPECPSRNLRSSDSCRRGPPSGANDCAHSPRSRAPSLCTKRRTACLTLWKMRWKFWATARRW